MLFNDRQFICIAVWFVFLFIIYPFFLLKLFLMVRRCTKRGLGGLFKRCRFHLLTFTCSILKIWIMHKLVLALVQLLLQINLLVERVDHSGSLLMTILRLFLTKSYDRVWFFQLLGSMNNRGDKWVTLDCLCVAAICRGKDEILLDNLRCDHIAVFVNHVSLSDAPTSVGGCRFKLGSWCRLLILELVECKWWHFSAAFVVEV